MKPKRWAAARHGAVLALTEKSSLTTVRFSRMHVPAGPAPGAVDLDADSVEDLLAAAACATGTTCRPRTSPIQTKGNSPISATIPHIREQAFFVAGADDGFVRPAQHRVKAAQLGDPLFAVFASVMSVCCHKRP